MHLPNIRDAISNHLVLGQLERPRLRSTPRGRLLTLRRHAVKWCPQWRQCGAVHSLTLSSLAASFSDYNNCLLRSEKSELVIPLRHRSRGKSQLGWGESQALRSLRLGHWNWGIRPG